MTEIEEVSDAELRKILYQLDALSAKEGIQGRPSNDDELHAWIKETLEVDIPRVAVCPEHDAPFDFIADMFFDRVDAALVMANRGGGKSYLAAIWNFSNCYWTANIECLAVGAIEIQAKRVYSHIKQFQNKAAKGKIASTTISETLWKEGQKMEIVTGSLSSVNGPHSQRVHRDEIELMDKKVYDESLQIERAKTIGGKEIKSQTLLTSTRKTSDGLMQELLDECEDAVREGRKPPFKVYKFCIKECISQQKGCRVAYPDLPEDQKCNCNEVQKGEWREGEPRTFDQICGGAFSRSEGFIPLDDAQKTFAKSSKAMWEAQQECKRPYVEDISLENFSRERHGIRGFELDPANGPVYNAIDFGGSNPHAVLWGQVLNYEVEVFDYNSIPKRLPEGSLVLFSEIYISEIGNVKLADLIVAREREWKMKHPRYRVAGRFADPQAKAAKLDFRHHDPPLICSWPAITRDREEHYKRIRDRVDDFTLFVDLDACPMFVEEVEAWHIDVKKFDHAVDAGMYLVSNAYVLETTQKGKNLEEPEVAGKRTVGPGVPSPFNDNVPSAKPSELHMDRETLPTSEQWRLDLHKVGQKK
jgi:hypothetical protein